MQLKLLVKLRAHKIATRTWNKDRATHEVNIRERPELTEVSPITETITGITSLRKEINLLTLSTFTDKPVRPREIPTISQSLFAQSSAFTSCKYRSHSERFVFILFLCRSSRHRWSCTHSQKLDSNRMLLKCPAWVRSWNCLFSFVTYYLFRDYECSFTRTFPSMKTFRMY